MGSHAKQLDSGEMYTETVLITPKLAQKMLSKNEGNRKKIRKTCVDRYAREMEKGEWQLTHQGIGINTEGNLIDGQHRLHAVIKSGVPVLMRVTYNCGAQNALGQMIDVGARRTVTDITGHSTHKCAVATLIYNLCVPQTKSLRPTPSVIRDMCDIEEVALAGEWFGKNARFCRNSSLAGAACVAMLSGSRRGFCEKSYFAIQNSEFDHMNATHKAIYKYYSINGWPSNSYADKIAAIKRCLNGFIQTRGELKVVLPNDQQWLKRLGKAKVNLRSKGLPV